MDRETGQCRDALSRDHVQAPRRFRALALEGVPLQRGGRHPFRRDILGALKQACDRHGIRFGLYYSHWLDWEHAFGGRPNERDGYSGFWCVQPSDEQFEIYWQEKCLPQVAELSDAYAPALFWFDTWNWTSTPYINERRLDELIALVKAKNPACLITAASVSGGIQPVKRSSISAR